MFQFRYLYKKKIMHTECILKQVLKLLTKTTMNILWYVIYRNKLIIFKHFFIIQSP